jgi:hypothetical protein
MHMSVHDDAQPSSCLWNGVRDHDISAVALDLELRSLCNYGAELPIVFICAMGVIFVHKRRRPVPC